MYTVYLCIHSKRKVELPTITFHVLVLDRSTTQPSPNSRQSSSLVRLGSKWRIPVGCTCFPSFLWLQLPGFGLGRVGKKRQNLLVVCNDHEFGRCTSKHLENSLAFDPKKRNRRVFCQSRWWDFDDLMIVQGQCQFWHNLGEKPAESITSSANTPLQHLHIGVIGHQLNQQGGGCGQETTVQHLERWPMYIRSEKFDGEGAFSLSVSLPKRCDFVSSSSLLRNRLRFFHLLLIWEMGNHLEESHFEHRKKGSSKKKVILPQI